MRTKDEIQNTFLICLMLGTTLRIAAQDDETHPENRDVDMDSPTFEPMVKVGKVLQGKDSIQYVEVNNVYVYPEPVFKDAKQRMAYNRLVYNVKRCYLLLKK